MIPFKKQISYGMIGFLLSGMSITCTESQNRSFFEERNQFTYADYSSTEEFAQSPIYNSTPGNNNTPVLSYTNSNDIPSRGTSTSTIQNTITGTFLSNDVNVRVYPSTTSDIIKCLDSGVSVNIISRWDSWYKIGISVKTNGWVYKDFIKINNVSSTENILQRIPIEKPKDVTPVGQQLASYSKKYLGVHYVWGGTSPKGFDCSGFVQYVYQIYGVYLERVAADQARQGTTVTRDKLKPGDLVFFDTDGGHNYINHVGIYIGSGKFIQASSGYAHSVTVSDLSDGFYSNAYMTARRVF